MKYSIYSLVQKGLSVQTVLEELRNDKLDNRILDVLTELLTE